MLITVGMVILPAILITATRCIANKNIHTENKTLKLEDAIWNTLVARFMSDVYTSVFPAKLQNTLLLIGGIELNPGPGNFLCEYCPKTFTYKRNLTTHVNQKHLFISNIKCRFCSASFTEIDSWRTHMNTTHKPKIKGWQTVKSAFIGQVFELAYI